MLEMRKMKDSGIEWIGEIPEGWEIHRIKTHFSIISGSGFKPELQGQSTGDFPVCKASDISGSGHYLHTSANYISSDIVKSQHFSIIPKGSILFAKIGEAMRKNNRSLCSLDCCVDNNCQGLVPKNISSEFSYYLFTCIDMTWFDNAGTIPCINNQKLYDCRIPFPSYDEQLLIANHLNIQCDKINEMLFHIRASIEEYKKLKQAVITQAVTKGVRGEREMKKDSRVEWIGEIPKEWNIIKSSRIIKTTQNGLSRRDLEKSEGQIILKLKNITSDGKIDYSFLNRITLSQNELNTYALTTGDFLFVRVNGSKSLVGKCAIFEAISEIVAYNDHIIRVKLSNQCYNRFFLWYLYSCCGKAEIDLHTSTAAGQYTISGDGLRDITLVFPPIDEQKEIADYLDAKCAEIDGLIAKKEQLVKELETYKKSLIYEVVTGKREV